MKNYAISNFKYLSNTYPGGKRKFAETIGIQANYISKYVNGRLNISIDLIITICEKLSISSDEFLFKDLENTKRSTKALSVVGEPQDTYKKSTSLLDSSRLEQVIAEIRSELEELKKLVKISRELVS